ncbi:MAG: sigma-54-dependent transcriptional regulator [Imperialibacter sp.]|uniref:sigma-54-dependent transcriptional regulator n=1 Tax=Imperialibacter sp. TaxID=2038411 RepID=UPI003A8AE925
MPLTPNKILIVDDDRDVLTTARMLLKHHYEGVKTSVHPSEALDLMEQFNPDVVLLDMNFQRGENTGEEGLRALTNLLAKDPSLKVILLTAYGDINLAVEGMKAGAADFVVKPWSNEKLLATIQNALKLKAAEKNAEKYKAISTDITESGKLLEEELIGHSPAFKQVLATIKKVAPTDANVLLLGENGTGKDVMARYLHSLSTRNNQVFFRVDTGSLHEKLFESELFGHVKGAFTDAKEDKPGKFELAEGGTLFLDEIGNLSPASQAKILTALQQKTITRLGSNKPIPIDFRLISATNQPLAQMVADGEFRQDLLFRINTIEITLPTLRERRDDVLLLASHFISHFAKKYRKGALQLSDVANKQLTDHHWPGNIRELMHTMERAVIMAEGSTINYFDLSPSKTAAADSPPETLNLQENELKLINEALKKHQGNVTRAARELGIDRLALYRRMEKYGIK